MITGSEGEGKRLSRRPRDLPVCPAFLCLGRCGVSSSRAEWFSNGTVIAASCTMMDGWVSRSFIGGRTPK